MKIAIMQPYFLPYIGYWQLMNNVDVFVLLDDVNYDKQGWINRNRILINHSVKYITIPTIAGSQNKKITDIRIIKDEKWKSKLQKSIEYSYKKATNFHEGKILLDEIMESYEDNLSNFLFNSIELVASYLDLKVNLIRSSSSFENRNLKGKDRIIDICKQLSAEFYINPIGGQDLYDKSFFLENNIQLYFLKRNEILYPQFLDHFVSDLSILDMIMHCSKNTIINNLNKFSLIE